MREKQTNDPMAPIQINTDFLHCSESDLIAIIKQASNTWTMNGTDLEHAENMAARAELVRRSEVK